MVRGDKLFQSLDSRRLMVMGALEGHGGLWRAMGGSGEVSRVWLPKPPLYRIVDLEHVQRVHGPKLVHVVGVARAAPSGICRIAGFEVTWDATRDAATWDATWDAAVQVPTLLRIPTVAVWCDSRPHAWGRWTMGGGGGIPQMVIPQMVIPQMRIPQKGIP